MNVLDAFQGFVFKTRGAAVPAGKGGRCCGAAQARSSAECGTSTHDLFAYIWGTDGRLEAELASQQRLPPGPPAANPEAGVGRSPARHRPCAQPMRADGREVGACDASTSTFDLSAYVWDIAGCEDWPDAASEGSLDDFYDDPQGDVDRAGAVLSAGTRKRSRAGVSSSGGKFSGPPLGGRMVKRRKQNPEEELFAARCLKWG